MTVFPRKHHFVERYNHLINKMQHKEELDNRVHNQSSQNKDILAKTCRIRAKKKIIVFNPNTLNIF